MFKFFYNLHSTTYQGMPYMEMSKYRAFNVQLYVGNLACQPLPGVRD